ncbi:hypothetical protein [Streptomyces sp. NPDC051219]|uniref:hypothetical protein n=1 Tax=Streptomyces sp. NPDC051219 TaxID=3155283 RepID=UPI00342544AE
MLATATALAVAGVVPPTSAALETPRAGTSTTMAAGHGGHGRENHGITIPAVEWVKTTDSPSGITAELPGSSTVRKSAVPVDGKIVDVRLYGVEVADGFVGFVVFDLPGTQQDLDKMLQGSLEAYEQVTGETLTSSRIRKSTVDGHPALDARLSTEGGVRLVGATRFIADDAHLVQAVTLVPEANEKAMNQMHQRLIAGIRMP